MASSSNTARSSSQIAEQEVHFFVAYNLREARKLPSQRMPAAHQSAALGKLRSWFESSTAESRGGLMVLPTGGGKTFTAIRFLCAGPLAQGYKVLWLAHTHHLLEQAFRELGPQDESQRSAVGHIPEPRETLRVRVVSGTEGHYRVAGIDPADDVVIATLQTICKAFSDQTRGDGHPNLMRFLDSCDGKLCVVFDEAHHAPAPSYRRFIEKLRLRYSKLCLLGLTATPTYTDQRKRGWFGKLFPQGILYQVSPSELQAAGILAKPIYEEPRTHVPAVFDDDEYQKWLGTYGDIPEHIIKKLAENRERNELIANWYVNHKEQYGKTIIFADRWTQCEAIAALLKNRGIEAESVYSHVDASLPTVEARNRRTRDENARVLARFRAAKSGVLLNVRMLTEGTDLPDVQSVFLTRQTTSEILLTQMVGRALRGPKFGGTEEARIVCFIDDWKQMINWAGFHDLGGGADDDATKKVEHPPLQLISIELVSRLARQMDSGQLIAEHPFLSLLPIGWYRVEYQVVKAGSDDVEDKHELILVFDAQAESYKKLIQFLRGQKLDEFEGTEVSMNAVEKTLKDWKAAYFSDENAGIGGDLLWNLFRIARHIAQQESEPTFHAFPERKSHDLDGLVERLLDLPERKVAERLHLEFVQQDRFWRVLYGNYNAFKSQFDACRNRIIEAETLGKDPGTHRPIAVGEVTDIAADHEPTEEVKESVKQRDGWLCLCCHEDNRRLLQIDHIDPRYYGGSNALDNLQTLCRSCNQNRGTKGNTSEWNYRNNRTSLTGAPAFPTLEWSKAIPKDVRDTEEWEKFLRRTINTFYRCAAVESVKIGKRGPLFYRWEVRLFPGNNPSWLDAHLDGLAQNIRSTRQSDGVGGPDSIVIL